jgi:hypothetical protein
MDAGGIGTLVVLEVQPENPIKKQYDVRSPEFDSSRAERIRGTPQACRENSSVSSAARKQGGGRCVRSAR